MCFAATGIYIIITNPTYSTRSHNAIIALVNFLLRFVFIIDVGRKYRTLRLLPDIHVDYDDDDTG